jgi:hypothetical protein
MAASQCASRRPFADGPDGDKSLNAPLPIAEPARSIDDVAVPAGGREAPFIADGRDGPDLLDTTNAVRPLVELIAHRNSQTPMMIGIVGPSGAGKSFALRCIIAGVEAFGAAAKTANGPFVSDIVTVALDARTLVDDPATALAGATYAALCRDAGDGRNYTALADEAAHAGADPHAAASKALERHDEARRRVEAERQSRDDLEARRARLSDLVLFETPGSRVDAYARANRGRIEARLRRFDLVTGEPIANFKDLVRDLAGAGSGARAGMPLRAIWAYRSQTRLLFAGIVFFALSFGAGELRSAAVINWLSGLGAPFAAVADWLSSHGAWIDDVVAAFIIIGFIALALNLWRAFAFTTSLLRGVRLLNYDTRERGRDLDAASARLNRRLSALTAEADAAARHAEAAEKRAKSQGPSASPARGPTPLFLEPGLAPQAAARAFLTALQKSLAGQPEPGAPPVVVAPAPPLAVPKRIVLAIDNLDGLEPADALATIESVHSLLGRAFVAVLAFDSASMRSAVTDASRLRERLERLFQIVFNVKGAGAVGGERLVARLLGGEASAPPQAPIDARRSTLAEPMGSAEAAVLTAIAPLAASTPRAVKRFLNVYRLARVGCAERTALALTLAVEQSGDGEARTAVEGLLAKHPDGALGDPAAPPALLAAMRAARASGAGAITAAGVRSAMAVAARYQFFM